jgi:hypothetical protein
MRQVFRVQPLRLLLAAKDAPLRLNSSLAEKVSKPVREAISEPGAVATGSALIRKAPHYTITLALLGTGDPVATASGSDTAVNDLFLWEALKL